MSDMIPDSLTNCGSIQLRPQYPGKWSRCAINATDNSVKGPIPLNHLALAAQAPGKALHVEEPPFGSMQVCDTWRRSTSPMRWLKVTFGVDRYNVVSRPRGPGKGWFGFGDSTSGPRIDSHITGGFIMNSGSWKQVVFAGRVDCR